MDLNQDVICAYDRYYRPRGYGYNMPEYYHGGLDEDNDLRIRQKKTRPVVRDDKKENAIEQD